MPDLDIDTTAPEYTVRHQQFSEIRAYYAPRIRRYVRLSPAQQKAWRQADPFLRDILDFGRKIYAAKDDVQ